jgi:glycosyltransferase involved in cell wall biosynthesis
MKILHIIPAYKPAYSYGGPTESVSRLCEGLAANGHEVDVYATTANGKAELDVIPGEVVNVDGVNVTYFKRFSGDKTNVSPALWLKLIKTAKNYDVIHLHSWWNTLIVIAAYLSLKSKKKVIVAPRGMLSKYTFTSGKSGYKKYVHKLMGRKVLSQCVLHATAYSEYLECRELIPGWEGFVLSNIIPLPASQPLQNVNEVFTIIFLSRIHPKKGLEMLFEAISRLDINIKLKIAGNGDEVYIEGLKNLALNLKIASKLEWVGWLDREEKFKELNNADLFILVSLNENFANVVIESLHMGTAVLISENVGLADFVKEKNLGWICTLEVESIVKKLNEAYNDKEKLRFIRNHGRIIIEEVFREDVLIGQYVKEYQK